LKKPEKPEITHPTTGRLAWLRWVEPWYLAYALLGVSVAGLIPILIPLLVNSTGNVAQVGLVMAGFSFGGLAAPLWGSLADRFRLHRVLLVGGLFLTALGLALFPFAGSSLAWLLLALLQGVGSGGAATVANLFIVEVHPQLEWDERIGWLQTFYGGGQVLGLLAAGAFSQSSTVKVGVWAAAAITLAACLVGLASVSTPSRPVVNKPILLHPARTAEWPLASPQRLFHHLTAEAVANAGQILHSAFGLFLAVWVLTFGGTAVVFSLYPVLMQGLFKISPSISSSVFALAAALGLLLYSPAGHWSGRFGTRRVMLAGFGVRLVAILLILILGIFHDTGLGWAALLGFCLIVLAWSLLSVSSTALAAALSPGKEGAGLGFFNATTAIAGVLGSILGGWIASRSGFLAAVELAGGGILAGLILFALSGRKGVN
jgi:DHA1 family tetracycline resistance protein-like MFS transporter